MKFHIEEQGSISISYVKVQRGRNSIAVDVGTDSKYPMIKCFMTSGNKFFFDISNRDDFEPSTVIIIDIGKVTGQWFVGTDQDKHSCLALFSRVIVEKMKPLEITPRPE